MRFSCSFWALLPGYVECAFIVLVPISITEGIRVLYVFVEIQLDLSLIEALIVENFPTIKKLAIISTVQFLGSIHVSHHFDCRNSMQTYWIVDILPFPSHNNARYLAERYLVAQPHHLDLCQ